MNSASVPFRDTTSEDHVLEETPGFLAPRPARLDASSFAKIEIIDGLAPEDRTVISGTDAFNNTHRVAISHLALW